MKANCATPERVGSNEGLATDALKELSKVNKTLLGLVLDAKREPIREPPTSAAFTLYLDRAMGVPVL
jgi:hypothetical protein